MAEHAGTPRPGQLAVVVGGTAGAPAPLAMLHGFAQDSRCLGPISRAWDHERRVLLLDAPGHGGSYAHRGSDLEDTARLIHTSIEPHAAAPAVLVGYSMGARMALVAALSAPTRFAGLVLISGTAGIDDPAERDLRRGRDHELADRIERIGVESFVDEWLAGPMFSGLEPWARFDEERRDNRPDGLASSLRRCGTGSMDPRWEELAHLELPVLCISGADDPRYVDLSARICDTAPSARHVVVDGAGHSAHLEAPGPTIDAIGGFLARLG